MERPPVLFTAHSHQILSTCVHLLGVSVLSHCLASRMPPFLNWREWINLPWGRACVVLVLMDSWLFVFFTGVLVNGMGLSHSSKTCALAIYACISFYGLSKVLIYGFLVERVYIVWSGGNQTPRFRTPAYRICSVVLLGYIAVLILMIIGKNSFIREDGMCIIGLKDFATYPMISYDLFLNIFLTGMFLFPLWWSTFTSSMLQKLAKRTLIGAIASLMTSAANIAILTGLHGQEYGWVCLGSCVTDVTLNAIALSWVTASSHTHSPMIDRFSLPTMDVGPLTLTQTECKEPTSITQTTLSPDAAPHPLPDLYYDYIPRPQPVSPENDPTTLAKQANIMQRLRNFKASLSRVEDAPVTESTCTDCASSTPPLP